MNCTNCNSNLHGEFCSNCGQSQELKRINGQYIFSEISSVLNFDKGILYTIKELLIRPGISVRKFILEDRKRLVRPIIFIIITSLIYTIAQQWLNFEDGYVNFSGEDDSATVAIFSWIQKNYGYSNILMAIFIAFWIKVFFRKYDYNFFEILILLCFVMGIGMLIYTAFAVFDNLTSLKTLQIGGIIGFLYSAWAIGRFFDKDKKINYLKGLVSYFLGFLTFSLGAIALGTLIDMVLK